MKLNPYVTQSTKINSKWARDQNVRPEITKLLGHIIEKLQDILFGNDFWIDTKGTDNNIRQTVL